MEKLKFRTVFYWSLGGHGVFLVFLLISSLFTSCSKKEPEQVHIFRLQAGPPAPAPAKASTPAPAKTKPTVEQPKPTKSKPEVKKPDPKPPVKKPTPKPTPTPVIKKPNPVQKPKPEPEPEVTEMSYEDFLKENPIQQEAPTPEPVIETPNPQPTPQPAVDPYQDMRNKVDHILQGMEGDASASDSQVMNEYLAYLRSQIHRIWVKPSSLTHGHWTATVEFTVEANGKVSSIRFVKKSGQYDFDHSLQQALKSFKTTQPPPGGKRKTFTIPLTVKFG